MLSHQRVDGLLVEVCEDLDVAFSLHVAHVKPELVEGIRSGAVAVEPHVAALCLSKLLAVALCDERTGETVSLGLVAQRAANQFSTRGHVTPLVVASKLQTHAIFLILIEEVVALQELIGELGERQSVA